jgi:hypothetical protein
MTAYIYKNNELVDEIKIESYEEYAEFVKAFPYDYIGCKVIMKGSIG